MRAPWPYMQSIRVGVNTRRGCTLESTRSLRDQRSKVPLEPSLANVHSAADNTPSLVHMRSTCDLSHPGLDIVLASTIQYIIMESRV